MRIKIGTFACVAVVLACVAVANAQSSGPTTRTPPQNQPSGRNQNPNPAPNPNPNMNQPSTGMSTMPNVPSRADVNDDITRTFGFIPEFMRQMPDTLAVGFWVNMKMFEMNQNTALDGKTKELIGLAVASGIPCEYCIYFHTMAAKKNGASDQEIKEAVGMASMTKMGSTILNGMQLDRPTFRRDVDRIMKGETKGKSQASRTP